MNDFDNRQIYCIKGCNDATNFYFKWIRQEVQVQSLLAPALIPDSLTSTSLSLEWSVPTKFSELAKGNLFKKTKNETYFVQCYEDYEDVWKLCGVQTVYENSTIHMEELQPYTKYKVRFSHQISLVTLKIYLLSINSLGWLCSYQKMRPFILTLVSLSAQMKMGYLFQSRKFYKSVQSIKRGLWCRGSRA
jgi:hypothetical protein